MKIPHDKYYTPPHLVNLVIQRTKDVIGVENITEFIEPSAGNGSFLNSLYETGIPTKAYDLYPEREDIIKRDYLQLEMEYKEGRCVIGNPPFGKANSLIKKFYKHSIKFSDYIIFILPISQFNNNFELYDFDLIYSENLGLKEYSKINLHCCLNIYKRPLKGLNNKPSNKLKDIQFIGWRKANIIDSDFKIICYGNRTGDIIFNDEIYANSLGVIIKNKQLYNKIFKVIKDTKWKELYPNVSTPNLLQWKIVKYLKSQIPELE